MKSKNSFLVECKEPLFTLLTTLSLQNNHGIPFNDAVSSGRTGVKALAVIDAVSYAFENPAKNWRLVGKYASYH